MSLRVTSDAVQLHGGYGYMLEYPIARSFVDMRVTRIYGGTSEVMRDLIQTFNEKDPDLLKISKLINKDPVISAKLLRLANSAKFGNKSETILPD